MVDLSFCAGSLVQLWDTVCVMSGKHTFLNYWICTVSIKLYLWMHFVKSRVVAVQWLRLTSQIINPNIYTAKLRVLKMPKIECDHQVRKYELL